MKPSRSMMWRFFWTYTAVASFGIVMITLNNLYVNGFTWDELAAFNIKAKLILGALLVASFMLITHFRFKPVKRYLDGGPTNLHEVWHRLVRFPNQMFWNMIVYGLIVSPAYHLIDNHVKGRTFPHWDERTWLIVVRNIVLDETLCFTLCILFYSLLRRIVRSYIVALPGGSPKETYRESSFLRPLLITFAATMLITIGSLVWYMLNSVIMQHPVNVFELFGIAAVTAAFGLCLMLALALEIRNELRVLIGGIRSLLGGDRAKLHGKMPIMSRDEVGELAAAFNELQLHISREYEEVDKDLKLAYQVQQKLLPKMYHELGSVRIAAVCEQIQEVGGDLFDVVQLGGRRTAVICGDVSGKGMPAALIMSSVMVLFRTEIRRGGTAGQVMTRLNRILTETMRGDMYVSLGIAVIDEPQRRLEYASAGHMAPYRLGRDGAEQLMFSSLPLGVSLSETYEERHFPFEPGHRYVFYTDGVIEQTGERGEMVGFEQFERLIGGMNGNDPLQEQLRTLLDRFPTAASARDDRTIVLVAMEDGG